MGEQTKSCNQSFSC